MEAKNSCCTIEPKAYAAVASKSQFFVPQGHVELPRPLFIMVCFLTGECIFPPTGCPCFYCNYVSLLSFLILEFKNLEAFQKLTLYHHTSQYEH